jgi:hypothetical protein
MTDCQFCARDNGMIWTIELAKYPPSGDYWVTAGCLRKLHTQVYLVCARHLAIFREMFLEIPCPDCEILGQEISYLGEVLWERRKDVESDPVDAGEEDQEN